MSAPATSNPRQAAAEKLLRRCVDGDHRAIDELFRMYSGLVLRVTAKIVRSREEAEEIRQEVFLYAWQRAETYDPGRGTVSTWLTRIARSRAIDSLRRAGTQERTRVLAARETPVSIAPSSEHAVYLRELRPRVRRALRALPPLQRQALVLAYYGDMTQREIAAHSHTPLGTVKTRTSLALGKLRRRLDPQTLAMTTP